MLTGRLHVVSWWIIIIADYRWCIVEDKIIRLQGEGELCVCVCVFILLFKLLLFKLGNFTKSLQVCIYILWVHTTRFYMLSMVNDEYISTFSLKSMTFA